MSPSHTAAETNVFAVFLFLQLGVIMTNGLDENIGIDLDVRAISKIQSGLFSTKEEKRSIIVTFGTTEKMEEIAVKVSEKYEDSSRKEERIHALYKALNEYAELCQFSSKSYLESSSYTYHIMWAMNAIVIKDADEKCAHTLSGMKDVLSISEDGTIALEPIRSSAPSGNRSSSSGFSIGFSWGLSRINVKQAWKFDALFEERKIGKGILIGHIDTGVYAEHEQLRDSFRRVNGWADGYNISKTPIDNVGHGTHTLATIVGKNAIGAAPGAQWISCRGCLSTGCLHSTLLFCCQWVICPYNTSEKVDANHYKNCRGAPDLVSNSWGGGQADPVYDRCIYALHAAGIIPVWTIGNEGPKCMTAESPGDRPYVISVGATDKDNKLAPFSALGPSVDGRMKPEITAPGVAIISAWIGSPTSYYPLSGTSMAAPHVAGVIALMLERCKLPYKMILAIIQNTAEREDLGTTTHVCGSTLSKEFPNNFYGYGLLNAFEAVKKAVQLCRSNRYTYFGGKPAGHSSVVASSAQSQQSLPRFNRPYTIVPYRGPYYFK